MKKQFFKMGITAVVIGFAMTSCKNSPYPGYEESETGVYTKFYKHDENGVKPKEGDVVRVTLLVKDSKDSVLSNSKEQDPTRPPGVDYFEMELTKSPYKGSIQDGIASMSVGDSASFLIAVDSMFKGRQIPPFIKKGTMLTYTLKLRKIISKEELMKEEAKRKEEETAMKQMSKNEEPKILARYIEENKITVKPTASGLYYIELKKGSGPKAKIGDMILVNYTGRLLDGRVFDTNDKETAQSSGNYDARKPYGEPVTFPLNDQLFKGWVEALPMMNKGTKARIVLPSSLAIGEGSSGIIPPYAPMVFEVELVDIKPGK
ncbi:MAG TPA: FKBP-type peptidyl-prolyl cis-trans isomerase [Bacteroidia bacterium]|jgi:FKBP-type peptidyl-prolyl cis-trans isomerase|nr:FKBP-type peptidyl-prolyl cis-trans isomerase [Bacteroidia bacterium]